MASLRDSFSERTRNTTREEGRKQGGAKVGEEEREKEGYIEEGREREGGKKGREEGGEGRMREMVSSYKMRRGMFFSPWAVAVGILVPPAAPVMRYSGRPSVGGAWTPTGSEMEGRTKR